MFRLFHRHKWRTVHRSFPYKEGGGGKQIIVPAIQVCDSCGNNRCIDTPATPVEIDHFIEHYYRASTKTRDAR